MNHRRATIELCAQFVIIAALLAFAGVENWLWMFVIPFAVQNYVLTSHIATNHNLCPMATNNDPLDVSLTVTNHPILEFLTVNFGYHVEHHLFPSINGRYTKDVHKVLVKLFPKEYKYMPKWEAMKRLYSTPRIYKSSHLLIHPETLKTYETI